MICRSKPQQSAQQDYCIYILVTKSKTCFSRLIHRMTAAPYTHASIGLNGLQGEFYSFARKYTRLCLPGGLVKEMVCGGGPKTVRYQMYQLNVSPAAYFRIQERLGRMYGHRERYHYNLLGALSAFFNYPLCRRRYYFCSQFVAELLETSGALRLEKNAALVRPVDFCSIDGLHLVSEGSIRPLGSGRAFPAPSEVASALPFGKLVVRAYRCHFRSHSLNNS